MTYGIFLIIFLVVISGFIAYVGDRVGHKIGKKRISIFGFRPRHTSIMVTIVTGILIVSLTLAVLLGISGSARESFFGLERLRAALDHLRTDLKSAKKQLNDSKLRRENILKTINTRTAELKQLQTSAAELQKNLGALQEQKNTLIAENKTLENEKKSLQSKAAEIANQLGDAAKTCLYGKVLYTKDQPLARIAVPAGATGNKIETQIRKTIALIQNAAEKKGALIDPNLQGFLDAQLSRLEKSIKNINTDSIVEIRSATNVLEGELFIAKLSLVENKLVYHDGDVLETVTIPPGTNRKQVEALLEEALLSVSTRARADGIITDVETGKVASVPYKRFTQIVGEAAAKPGGAAIAIFVRGNTHITGKLQVDFRVND